jgi:hypothetical protein
VLICSRTPKEGAGPAVLVLANFAPERRLVPCASLPGLDIRSARDLLAGAPPVIEEDSVVLDAYRAAWIE